MADIKHTDKISDYDVEMYGERKGTLLFIYGKVYKVLASGDDCLYCNELKSYTLNNK